MRLDYGLIESLSVQVPLLSLLNGQVNIFIDNVTIMFSLHIRGDHYKSKNDIDNDDNNNNNSDHYDNNDGDYHHQVHKNLSHELKTVSLHKNILSLFGIMIMRMIILMTMLMLVVMMMMMMTMMMMMMMIHFYHI